MSDVEPKVNPHEVWRVNRIERLSACDNRPGLKKIYVQVVDERGIPLPGVKVRFDTEPSLGIAYDHPNVFGLTNENGYLEWDHLGVPTRYLLWMEDDETPLIENIRTDLGNEYCNVEILGGWRPVNRPGIYSYRVAIQRKGEGVPIPAPVISNVQVNVFDDDQEQGYASGSISFETDIEAEVRVYHGLYFKGGAPGEPIESVCDPFSSGWRGIVVSEPGRTHLAELPRSTLWYSREARKQYCLVVVAWPVGYPHVKAYSEAVSFTLPSER